MLENLGEKLDQVLAGIALLIGDGISAHHQSAGKATHCGQSHILDVEVQCDVVISGDDYSR